MLMFSLAPRLNSGHAQKVLTIFSWPVGTSRKTLSLLSLFVILQNSAIANPNPNVAPLPGGICRSPFANPTACVYVETFVAAVALGSIQAAQNMIDQAPAGLSSALLNAATVGLGVITNGPASVELLLQRSGPRVLRKTWIHSEVIQMLPNYWEILSMARRNSPELGFPLTNIDFQMSALQLTIALDNRLPLSERILNFNGGNWEMAQTDSAKNTILHYLIFFDRPLMLQRWSNMSVFPRYLEQLVQMLDHENSQGITPLELINRIYPDGSEAHIFWTDIVAQLTRIRSRLPNNPAGTSDQQTLRNGGSIPPAIPRTRTRTQTGVSTGSLVVSSRI